MTRIPAVMRPVASFPGYWAGDDGVIYSTRWRGWQPGIPPRPLSPGKTTKGYHVVNLVAAPNVHRMRLVHKLVCEAFHGPCPPGLECSHQDDDKDNNRPSNLRWETKAANHARRYLNGIDDRGVLNSRAVLTTADVQQVHAWLAEGVTTLEIAIRLNVSRTTISRVKNGRRYR